MLSPPPCSHTVPTGRRCLPQGGAETLGGSTQHPAARLLRCANPSRGAKLSQEKTPQTLLFPHPRARDLGVLRQLLLCSQFGPGREMGTPPSPPVPGWKRALEAQVRAQLSFLPILLQVRVARGGTEPDRHFTSSEGHAPAGDDKRGRPRVAQSHGGTPSSPLSWRHGAAWGPRSSIPPPGPAPPRGVTAGIFQDF